MGKLSVEPLFSINIEQERKEKEIVAKWKYKLFFCLHANVVVDTSIGAYCSVWYNREAVRFSSTLKQVYKFEEKTTRLSRQTAIATATEGKNKTRTNVVKRILWAAFGFLLDHVLLHVECEAHSNLKRALETDLLAKSVKM